MKFKLDNVAVHTEVIQRVASFNTSADQFDDFEQLATELAEAKQALEFALKLAQFVTTEVHEGLVIDTYDDLEGYLP